MLLHAKDWEGSKQRDLDSMVEVAGAKDAQLGCRFMTLADSLRDGKDNVTLRN